MFGHVGSGNVMFRFLMLYQFMAGYVKISQVRLLYISLDQVIFV
jgi:hypothetical protein